MNRTKLKILAIASVGGHWIELLRITQGLETAGELVFVSTHDKCKTMVTGHKYYTVSDFSRWNFYKSIPVFFKALRILFKENADVVITTGAAPGLIFLFAAKLSGKKTIWIDSVANVLHLSMSGRIASKFASQTYTQWEELSNEKIFFAGNVLD